MTTPRSRKRLRYSDESFKIAPPPFAPAEAALAQSYRALATRSMRTGPTQPIVNLAVIAAHRLAARDFAGAASLVPVLMRRFRTPRSYKWSFPREVVISSAEVLRRSGSLSQLEKFLSLVARDHSTSVATMSRSVSYAQQTRDYALLELTMERVAAGRVQEAYDALRTESSVEPFASSPLVHGYLGLLAVALAPWSDDPRFLLLSATKALNKAAQLDPAAHCFVHSAAGAALACGDSRLALELQRDFAARYPDDPLALSGLLATLGDVSGTGPSENTQAERVVVARKLLKVDPISDRALGVLQEALNWNWSSPSPVDELELAEAYATRIECGTPDTSSWSQLCATLQRTSSSQLAKFLHDSGRSSWWMSHFFRARWACADASRDAKVATAKRGVARIMFGECDYVRAGRSFPKSEGGKVSDGENRVCD